MARGRLSRPDGVVAAGVGVAVVGLIGYLLGNPRLDPLPPVLALLTGWFVALVGAATTRAAAWSRTGPLLLASGLAWFMPLLVSLRREWAPSLGSLPLLWAAILAHAILALPGGRVRAPSHVLLVGGGYAATLLPAGPASLALAGVLLAGIGLALADRRGHDAVPSVVVLGAAGPLVLVFLVSRVLPVLPGAGAIDLRPALQLAFMASAGVVGAWTIAEASLRTRVTDLVVELGEADPGSLRAGLARALQDPRLRVGIVLDDGARTIDDQGRPFTQAAPGDDRATTTIERNGRPIAILEHRADLSADPALLAAIARAASLATANAALLAELSDRAAELRASRARLVGAADQARLDIRRRLRETLDPRLDAQMVALGRPPIGPRPDTDAIARGLGGARRELRALADGVHPAVADGTDLGTALRALADRCPMPVAVTAPPGLTLDPVVQRHLLFIAGEALANIVKHARAAAAEVRLESHGGAVRLVVADDGDGGADPAAGTGLAGLHDRAAASGGSLRIESRRGHGTMLVADLPAPGARHA